MKMVNMKMVDVGRPEDPATQSTIREMEQEGWQHFKVEPQGNGRYLAYFRKTDEND